LKFAVKFLIAVVILTAGGGDVWAGKGRKLPVGAYLKSAKIEILSGELERYKNAIAMLDSLFLHYGPHAEGLYLMGQIMVDYIEKTPDPEQKAPYIEKMVAYFDTLHMACENKKIKKSYRKGCKKYIVIADSLKVKYWRQFFNAGVAKLGSAEQLRQDMDNEADSSIRAIMERDFKANLDSTIQNMKLALIAIPDSTRTYLIIDKAYGLQGDFQTGIDWLKKGLEQTKDSAIIIPSIAYDYIQLNDYCGAIPYYKASVQMDPESIANLINLAICYHNCEFYDSAATIYYRILALQPDNVDILINVGIYFNRKAGMASDSATKYQDEGNEQMAKTWRSKRDEAFDSSRVYFKRAFELKPDDAFAAEQYAVVSALLGDCQEAIRGFAKVAEMEPERTDNWISLGDCHLTLKQFDEAINAYEKAVELDPTDIRIWEHLKDLYYETGRKEKLAEAEKKIAELKQ
jgi:tetratricopeptide (TPR) repeat protein